MAGEVDVRAVFARNLEALFAHARDTGRMELSSANQLQHVTGIADTTLNNYRAGKTAINIVHLAKIAIAYGTQPWELLRPDFDPASLPSQREKLTKEELDALRERVLKALNLRQ